MATTEELLQKYFVQPGGTTDPTSPVPRTFSNCRVTPLIDLDEYSLEIESALANIGVGDDKAVNARDEFILVHNWYLGLTPGRYNGPTGLLGSGKDFGVWDTLNPAEVNVPEFFLDGPPWDGGGTRSLQRILIEKANRGVDVRVLGWVSYGLMGSGFTRRYGPGGYVQINATTMNTIKTLRASSIGARAMMNVIGHTGGATHLKMVVIGNATETIAFTGGLDFGMDRWGGRADLIMELPALHTNATAWHDVVAKVEGPAVQALYDAFQKMWHENISRPARVFDFQNEELPSFLPRTPVLRARAVVVPADVERKHHVQSMRTVCPFNYAVINCVTEGRPASFAPDGLFEVKRAWEKGIRAAETYIYMEDQSFWSQEVLTWVGETLRAKPNLKAVLVTSGGGDPADPKFPENKIFTRAFNEGMFKDLAGAELERVKGQIKFYKLWSDYIPDLRIALKEVAPLAGGKSLVTMQHDPYQPLGFEYEENVLATLGYYIADGVNLFHIVGNEEADKGDPALKLIVENAGAVAPTPNSPALIIVKTHVVVHPKTTLVDDQWALIGSANCMRRSLYTDWEHAISFIDEDQAVVKEYRKRLWCHLFRHDDKSAFEDVQSALHSFDPTWGVAGGAAPPLPQRPAGHPQTPYLVPVTLPISPAGDFGLFEEYHHDLFDDTDARESWGGLCTVLAGVFG